MLTGPHTLLLNVRNNQSFFSTGEIPSCWIPSCPHHFCNFFFFMRKYASVKVRATGVEPTKLTDYCSPTESCELQATIGVVIGESIVSLLGTTFFGLVAFLSFMFLSKRCVCTFGCNQLFTFAKFFHKLLNA